MGRRIRWLGLVLILCFALVILQLVNIQYRQAPALNASGTNPRNAGLKHDNQRGEILAATGEPLARSVRNPKAGPNTYQYYRTYPTGTLFAGVVGYSSRYRTNGGVENVYNTQLSLHHQTATSFGQLLSPPPPTTDNVTLTVQPSIQEVAKAALAANPDANKDGAVVVLNPKTGAVLAMYSSPSFDPNTLSSPTYTKEKVAAKADFLTPDAEGFLPGQPMATWYPVLPGSTFKVVTSSAVYNLKPSFANFTYPVVKCTNSAMKLPTAINICNDYTSRTGGHPCGGHLIQMLPESCDPGYATLGYELGATALSQQAELFGYNAVPPIDLTARWVQTSRFPSVSSLQEGSSPGPGGVAYAAFGQGTVSTTALQNAMVAEGIADTGVVMTPHVMAAIRNADGALVRSYTPTAYKTAESASAAKSVNTLMQAVVTTPAGTAHGVGFTPQDKVAVKTGTAQVGTPPTTVNDWMIGFAPYTDPTVAVAVVVPKQPTTTAGATIAGPIFKAVIEAALAQQRASAPRSTTTTTVPRRSTTTTRPAPPATTAPVPATTTTTAPAPATTTTVPVLPTTTTPTAATPPPATTTTGAAGAAATSGNGTVSQQARRRL